MILLNNYWETLRVMDSAINSGSSPDQLVSTTMRDTSGADLEYVFTRGFNNSIKPYCDHLACPFAHTSIIVGKGTSAPTVSDYQLESDITSLFSGISKSISRANRNGHFVVIITWTGVNNSGEDQTISEIGGFVKLAKGTSGSTSFTSKDVLIFRHVLAEPVVIPDGESNAFTMEIEMQ